MNYEWMRKINAHNVQVSTLAHTANVLVGRKWHTKDEVRNEIPHHLRTTRSNLTTLMSIISVRVTESRNKTNDKYYNHTRIMLPKKQWPQYTPYITYNSY